MSVESRAREHAEADATLLAAVIKARADRARLAKLLREGVVSRDPTVGFRVPGAVEFRAAIEDLARPKIDLAIRPNKKKRGKRR